MLRIVITANCLRYDIAAQLAKWLPGARIVTGTLPDPENTTATNHLRVLLADADLWLTMGSAEESLQILDGMSTKKPAVCRFPAIGFAAFHPDVCFAVNAETGKATRQVFNSAIAVWAYRQSFSAKDAAAWFTAHNFKALGYFNAWDSSVTFLRDAFAASDLAEDFASFFYAVKRQGCFMQTFNHPKPLAIASLCRLICQRTGLQTTHQQCVEEGSSPASRLIWPVYPEIAQNLGLASGSFDWLMNGERLSGVDAYLVRTFADYQKQGIAPHALQPLNRDLALLDRVLQ